MDTHASTPFKLDLSFMDDAAEPSTVWTEGDDTFATMLGDVLNVIDKTNENVAQAPTEDLRRKQDEAFERENRRREKYARRQSVVLSTAAPPTPPTSPSLSGSSLGAMDTEAEPERSRAPSPPPKATIWKRVRLMGASRAPSPKVAKPVAVPIPKAPKKKISFENDCVPTRESRKSLAADPRSGAMTVPNKRQSYMETSGSGGRRPLSGVFNTPDKRASWYSVQSQNPSITPLVSVPGMPPMPPMTHRYSVDHRRPSLDHHRASAMYHSVPNLSYQGVSTVNAHPMMVHSPYAHGPAPTCCCNHHAPHPPMHTSHPTASLQAVDEDDEDVPLGLLNAGKHPSHGHKYPPREQEPPYVRQRSNTAPGNYPFTPSFVDTRRMSCISMVDPRHVSPYGQQWLPYAQGPQYPPTPSGRPQSMIWPSPYHGPQTFETAGGPLVNFTPHDYAQSKTLRTLTHEPVARPVEASPVSHSFSSESGDSAVSGLRTSSSEKKKSRNKNWRSSIFGWRMTAPAAESDILPRGSAHAETSHKRVNKRASYAK
ncbi:uncharacterized protein EV422DRAFT_361294 [Fimicolochytrium jonesii]|uniref:uncharacterized protein n=1 Tax=Fimicolochytrium jonesii TaxID=1396493 RepID=UPI0022FEF103|nr:uncharacterized protein EV422DRAFT_361294 [Fimicolochytrium jonesii]KAI8823592.1 hypothetical protein EV422DRAFT_361294 [Fimicolochytrium jonesii]